MYASASLMWKLVMAKHALARAISYLMPSAGQKFCKSNNNNQQYSAPLHNGKRNGMYISLCVGYCIQWYIHICIVAFTPINLLTLVCVAFHFAAKVEHVATAHAARKRLQCNSALSSKALIRLCEIHSFHASFIRKYSFLNI